MTDSNPHSRDALEQRFGKNYRWFVLLTVMIGTMASLVAEPSRIHGILAMPFSGACLIANPASVKLPSHLGT